MTLFPMFVKLSGRKCVVAGAGPIAAGKAAGLLDAGARVLVVAPEAGESIRGQAREGKLTWVQREFAPSDLEDAFLAIAATGSVLTNQAVFRACAGRGVLCNVVDNPGHCDFLYPAVVRRGPLQIAVSTAGHSPALARRLRAELEQQFGPEYEAWLQHVAKQRRELLRRHPPGQERRNLLEQIASREAFEEFIARRAGKAPR